MPFINDENNKIPENSIVFYNKNNKNLQFDVLEILEPLKGHAKRDWFTENFYFCLPLTIANQYGFVIKAAYDFELYWGNENDPVYLTLNPDDSKNNEDSIQRYHTNFRNGILTVENEIAIRTPPGVNVLVMQPPNYFIPGLVCMSGVVESDNLRGGWTFNLKVTTPYTKICVKKGDWLSAFLPVPRYFVDKFEMVSAEDLFDKKVMEDERLALSKLGFERFNSKDIGGDMGKHNDSGRRYFKGIHPNGELFSDHQKTV